MIEFSGVTKSYNDHTALSDVSLSVQSGEMVFLTGHSGAGKSTALKLAMGIEKPSEGKIHIQNQDIARLPKRHLPAFRRRVGMIHQNPQLLSNKSIFDNIALPLIMHGYTRQEMKRRVHAALDKVSLLSKEKLSPQALSCGEQQRVGIARAIVNKPNILLADEPTGNLDPELSLDILRLFEAFQMVGVTVLIATHDLSLIAQMPHRMIVLNHGKIIKKGK
ncbi:MAG: cell division ATP-binding protein FtsE [Coxiellaceae bacterium]|nr:cell division ATP-binding protein FtsE [Coxiellaceae bacterium]